MVGTAMSSPTTLAHRPQSPEVRLLERVRDGTDDVAWAEFVNTYQPVLSAFVRKRGVYPADVPDVVQGILAQLVRALARFEYDPSRGQFRTWLWRVACNAASKWMQNRASRNRAEVAWCRQRPADTGEPEAGSECDRARALGILNRVLDEVRQTTAPTTWACFEGQVLRGRAVGEVAAELGVSANAVYVNACRVRARVRESRPQFPSQCF